MLRVLVAGGGISGLVAARTLSGTGIQVTLVEADDRLGGKIRTEHVNGFLIDAGPDSFLSSKTQAISLADDLGISDRIINTRRDGGGTLILRKGKLQPLPEGITLLVPAELRSIARSPLMSPLGKLRMSFDLAIPARKGHQDESVGEFVRRRLGRQAFERMAEPLLSGIFAGDADALSLASTFPRLREVERAHGGMIRGAIAQRRASKSAAPHAQKHTPFVSFRCGLSEFIAALHAALEDVDIRTGVALTSLTQSARGWRSELSDGSHLHADGVLLAIPAHTAADLLQSMSPMLASAMREIPWVSTATVSLAFAESALGHRRTGRGFVVPRAEGRSLTAVTLTSQKFDGRAPEGTALLRGFVGRAGKEWPAELPDDELLDLVLQELDEILGIRAKPMLARIYRWPKASPQYTLGHPERLQRIDGALSHLPCLAVTGNSYRGVGIPDCIANATERATALSAALSDKLPAQPMISR